MNVTIIGCGYVGLVTAACLADVGNDVCCFDVDRDKIDVLESGGIPIHEPGLHEIVARNKAAGRLSFTTDPHRAMTQREAIFIAGPCVPNDTFQSRLRSSCDVSGARASVRLVAAPVA